MDSFKFKVMARRYISSFAVLPLWFQLQISCGQIFICSRSWWPCLRWEWCQYDPACQSEAERVLVWWRWDRTFWCKCWKAWFKDFSIFHLLLYPEQSESQEPLDLQMHHFRKRLKDVKTYKFTTILCLLPDTLDPLTKYSNMDECSNMLAATLTSISTLPTNPGTRMRHLHEALDNEQGYQGVHFQASAHQKAQTTAACKTFVKNIKTEGDKRFLEENMTTLKRLDSTQAPSAAQRRQPMEKMWQSKLRQTTVCSSSSWTEQQQGFEPGGNPHQDYPTPPLSWLHI